MELLPDKAPATVKNLLDYVSAGHDAGTLFHGVFPGFMLQGRLRVGLAAEADP